MSFILTDLQLKFSISFNYEWMQVRSHTCMSSTSDFYHQQNSDSLYHIIVITDVLKYLYSSPLQNYQLSDSLLEFNVNKDADIALSIICLKTVTSIFQYDWSAS